MYRCGASLTALVAPHTPPGRSFPARIWDTPWSLPRETPAGGWQDLPRAQTPKPSVGAQSPGVQRREAWRILVTCPMEAQMPQKPQKRQGLPRDALPIPSHACNSLPPSFPSLPPFFPSSFLPFSFCCCDFRFFYDTFSDNFPLLHIFLFHSPSHAHIILSTHCLQYWAISFLYISFFHVFPSTPFLPAQLLVTFWVYHIGYFEKLCFIL